MGLPRPVDQTSKGAEFANSFCEHVLTPEFFEKHWEKLPLHGRAAVLGDHINRLSEGLTVDDVMSIIKSAGPSLKIFRQGDPYDMDNPLVGYLDGASLIVNQADRCNATLFEFSRTLAERHFYHAFCVAYLTPPAAKAVRLHNDDQDVFLLQVWGRKKWTIRNAPKLLAYSEEMLGKDEPVPPELIKEPLLEFTMEPHDFLYIPRGYLHEAETGDVEPSLHITITIPTSDFCWGVQMVKSFTRSEFSPEVKKVCAGSMSKGSELSALSDEALDAKIQEMVKCWSSSLSLDSLVNSFEQRMDMTNLGQDRTCAMAEERKPNATVTEACSARLMYGVRCQCDPDGEVAVFTRATDGRSLDMKIGKSTAPLIRSLTAKPQRVVDLPGKDPFERLCVLEVLAKHGVVQVCDSTGGPKTDADAK